MSFTCSVCKRTWEDMEGEGHLACDECARRLDAMAPRGCVLSPRDYMDCIRIIRDMFREDDNKP